MRLEISNVAKIKEATLNIDGITIIAGENNTGKSTIGKLLFAIFNSMNNMEEKVREQRNNKIYQVITSLVQSYTIQNEMNPVGYRRSKYAYFSRKLAESMIKVLQGNNTNNEIRKEIGVFTNDAGVFKDMEDAADFITECTAKLNALMDISDKKVMTEVITRWFVRVFENQMSPLYEEDVESTIRLFIKNKKLEYSFENNMCKLWNSEFSIMHQAFYIDNPFVMDYMSDRYGGINVKNTDAHLLKYLRKENDDIYEDIFDTVMAKDRLKEVYDVLEGLVDGDIIGSQDGEYYLKPKEKNKPLKIKNLSAGLKSFVLIKRLLENGSLKEKDVLILDEPEIHLHPEWQLIYAKLIVLLQKEFDLTMVVTTHSPYFLDAVDVFSAKYKISDRVNFYLSENIGEAAHLQEVTDNIDVIYKKLSDPMQTLENIRYGLR